MMKEGYVRLLSGFRHSCLLKAPVGWCTDHAPRSLQHALLESGTCDPEQERWSGIKLNHQSVQGKSFAGREIMTNLVKRTLAPAQLWRDAGDGKLSVRNLQLGIVKQPCSRSIFIFNGRRSAEIQSDAQVKSPRLGGVPCSADS